MLKGCQRRIIMVKDTGSKYFDSAYFVIKQDLPSDTTETDMLSEAQKMIDSHNFAGGSQADRTRAYDMGAPQRRIRQGGNSVFLGIIMSVLSASLTVAVMLILT